MAQIIVDTSALVAFFVSSEQHHTAAKIYAKQHPPSQWIILATIFDETVTWLRKKVSISSSIQIGYLLRKDCLYLPLTTEDDQATWDAFQRYDDKEWSYTDCSILVMAQRLNVFEVFSFDRHIQQMVGLGIRIVP